MAQHFYVKSGFGTRTAATDCPYTSQQSGSFASLGAGNVYASIEDVLATTKATDIAAGDYVWVSDAHSYSKGADYSVTLPASTTQAITRFVCVSDADVTVASTGAKESAGTGAAYMSLTGVGAYLYGLTLVAGEGYRFSTRNVTAEKCYLLSDPAASTTSAGWALPYNSADEGSITLIDCTLRYNGTSTTAHGLGLGLKGSTFKWYGGSVVSGTSVGAQFIYCGGGSGEVVIDGVDVSALNASSSYLVRMITTGYNLARSIKIRNCKIHSNMSLLNASPVAHGTNVLITNTAATSAAAEYQFLYADAWGLAQDATNIYRNESVAFESGTKVSLNVSTTAECDAQRPFSLELPTRFAELSVDGTLRLYLACATALTTADVWAQVTYPDSTDGHEWNLASTRLSDILSAGSALSTDSGSTWKDGASDLSGYNEYYLDIATTSPGDGVPLIRLFVGKASLTGLYIDTTVDTV